MRLVAALTTASLCLSLTACGDSGGTEPSAKQLAEAQARWLSLSRCLMGAPLEEGESATSRVRAIELSIVARGADAGQWPTGCGGTIDALVSHLSTFKQDAAVEKYGAIKGLWLGAGRVFRCHPFNSGGYDPLK